MKRLIALILLASAGLAHALSNDMLMMQRNPTDTGNLTRIIPWTATDSLFWFDGATVQPRLVNLGTGLSITSGTLNAAIPLPASINDAPGRSVVTATTATGYQISSTRNALACYEGTFQTTSTIGGPSSITIFLETANTNSTSPGDWTTIARQVNSNTITLAVVLQQVDIEPWGICRMIPAGKFVRIRSGSVTGTASATINAEQQETLQ